MSKQNSKGWQEINPSIPRESENIPTEADFSTGWRRQDEQINLYQTERRWYVVGFYNSQELQQNSFESKEAALQKVEKLKSR